jgi:hypothetical protein
MKRNKLYAVKSKLNPGKKLWSDVRTGTLRGIGVMFTALLLAGSAQQSRAAEVVVLHDFQSNPINLKGYSVTEVDKNAPDRGIAAAGNYADGNGIHFAIMDEKGRLNVSNIFKFPEEQDVRAISLVTIDANVFLLTIQARSYNAPGHIIVLMLDANGKVINKYTIFAPSDYGKHLFPSHSLVFNNNYLYICGNVNTRGEWPNDPLLFHDKAAFVARLELNSGAIDFRAYNTTQTTTPPNPTNPSWDGTINDYDCAMRLKEVNGNLYVMGSANGSATTVGTTSLAASKAWVSRINPTTLAPVTNSFFGNSSMTSTNLPNTANGVYALDLVPDTQNNGQFYCLTNDLQGNNWKLSHLGTGLTINTGTASVFNSVYYSTAGEAIKGYGVFNSNAAPGRVSLYGLVGTDVPLAGGSSVYGSTIENVYNGAIPFVIGADLSFSTASGIGYSGEIGHVEGSQISYNSSQNMNEAYWTLGGLREWCIPVFGVQTNPLGGADDLAMIGYYKNPWNGGYINPRFIGTDGDGRISPCPASQEMVLGLGKINLQAATLTLTSALRTPYSEPFPYDPADLPQDSEPDCVNDNVYRTAKPGAMELSSAKGIYPNPASGQVTVMLGSDAVEGAAVKVTLTDIAGRVVLVNEGKAAGGKLVLNLDRFTAGMYQVSVSINQGAPVVHKLVIQ